MADVDLGAIATRILELVSNRADAAVTVRRANGGLTRFANSFIHQNVGDEHLWLSLQVAVGGRTAASASTNVGHASLERLVETTLSAAAVQPADPEWPGLAPSAAPSGDPAVHFDRATAEATPAARADVVAAFVAAGDGLEAAGYCATTATHELFANSAGQRIESSTTSAAVNGIHRFRGADGSGSVFSSRLSDLDGARAGAWAAEAARGATRTIELPPGHYEVVLESRAVAYMLDFFSMYGFNARAVAEGRSFALFGEEQLDPALSMWDDATDARQIGIGFDAEGTPKRRVDLVDGGRVVGLTHDRRTAARAGDTWTSTGHAVPGGASLGAVATNLFVGGVETTPVSELVGRVRRGLLIRDFWYTRVLDPKSLVVTGLTRNGVFLIEDGQIGPAASNMRFTQSPVSAFGPGHVLGLGDDAALAPGGLYMSWHHAPSLHLAAWNFTGGTYG